MNHYSSLYTYGDITILWMRLVQLRNNIGLIRELDIYMS